MKQNIRIIALDLDGTLLNSNKELTDRNYKALERASREFGIEIVPCTGRFYSAVPQVIKDLPFVHYAITSNGAQVEDVREHTVLYKAGIPWNEALEIFDFYDTFECLRDCTMDDNGWIDESSVPLIEEFLPNEHYIRLYHECRTPVPDLREFVRERKEDILKTQIFVKDRELQEELLRSMPGMFPDTMVSSSVINNVEINHVNAQKGKAIWFLADLIGCDRSATMAFGDGLNDVGMIRDAGTGVCMENGCEESKAVADIIAPSCDEDGVAYIVEKLMEE